MLREGARCIAVLGYYTLVESDVIDMHRLTRIAPRGEDIGRSETLDEKWAKPQVGNLSLDVKGLVGYNSSPAWYSPQASRPHLPYADIPMMRDIVSRSAFDKIKFLWLGALFDIAHMIIVRKVAQDASPASAWYLPLQHCADSSVLVWPCIARKVGPFDIVEPSSTCAQPEFISVWSLDDWEVANIEAKSPAGQLKSSPIFCKLPQAIRIFMVGQPTTIMKAAASQCFRKLSPTFLHKVAKHDDVDLPSGASAFQIFFDMVTHYLSTSEADTLQILASRLGESSGDGADFGLSDIMELDDAAACLDQNHRKEITETQKKATRRAQEHREAVKDWVVRKTAVAARAPAAGKKRKRAQSVCGEASGSSSAQALVLPSCSLEQVSLKPFCPPGGYIWKGNKARTWNGDYPPFRGRSAAWSVYGMRGAAIEILRSLWLNHAEATGQQMPQDCPVRSLFDESAGDVPHAEAESSGSRTRRR